MSIEVRAVSKRFGSFTALHDLSLRVETGELVALLGPSGSGKTSLLRLIAGLDAPDQGQILVAGQDSTERRAAERRVGFVFQHYALFRHLSVFENVAFGLRVRPRRHRPSETAIQQRVQALLGLVQLEWLADRRPGELSGGQRQRVALARALAVEPQVLLLDEPFGSLGAQVRHELRRWLRRLHDEIRLTSVFVTHDRDEALEVADRVAVLNRGRIEQVGSPAELFEQPATPFVMAFLGEVNTFRGQAQAGQARLGPLTVAAPEQAQAEARPVSAFVRPYDFDLAAGDEGGGGLWATLRQVIPAGAVTRLEFAAEGADPRAAPLRVELPRDLAAAHGVVPGQRFYLRPRRVRLFPDA